MLTLVNAYVVSFIICCRSVDIVYNTCDTCWVRMKPQWWDDKDIVLMCMCHEYLFLYFPVFKKSYVTYQINFKLSTLSYRALSTQQPPYLASLLHLSNIHRQLRSSISQQLIVPKTKCNLGKRASSVTAPRVSNELPITLKTSETIAIFKKKTQDIFISNCISTINLWLSLVLIITFVHPC